ncbi:hypothetical protein B5S45_20195, partial [Morganella morganii]
VKPSFSSCSTVFGVAATRVSLVNRSLGMPIRMIFPSIGFIDDGLPVSGVTQAAHVRAKCYSVKIN